MSDRWDLLRTLTTARIGLGRAGHALPTSALLDFQLAHARARDAVHLAWDLEAFTRGVEALGLRPLALATPVEDRIEYLKRPDRGRQLSAESLQRLHRQGIAACDLVLIFTNGLSSTAMERHGLNLLAAMTRAFNARSVDIGPVCLVSNGRVALSDPIGAALNARQAVIVVGERPGLSAADSLGIYLTANPRAGNTDADRNCISNIHPPDGLGYEAAAAKLDQLSASALRLGYSGVMLKEDMAGAPPGLATRCP